ncbi:sterol-binding protein [Carbonactinospora thermoautotrophica]|uniref:SCP2 sterol-binding domain-containing protein n=1 Tax=Carbonactinospora thermoautotrophica TaxID=1469144 RepID=UPI0022703898|nr:SCP2 sterol-binding domain-containing protein [Carbonactinospora thermoautotrophica]MCX9193190.1 sterol-binding protein [Carbonactinospora thermoautotrophica]
MATVEECQQALEEFSARMAESGTAREHRLERSLSCHVTDLDVTFFAWLRNGRIEDITTESPNGKAQIRLALRSDDLVALVRGDLNFASAWAKGQVKLEAGMMDMLRLRSLF